MKQVKRTERGWAGHFICSDRCLFRRNTLLEYEDTKIVVSTVGGMMVENHGKREIDTVGNERYYETMAFLSDKKDTVYNDIDVRKQVYLDCNWKLNEIDDLKANEMHENAVDWVSKQMVGHSLVLCEDL